MPQFNNILIVTEDQVGEGSPLLVPGVSSDLRKGAHGTATAGKSTR
ncbi:hypothetical protein [Variovorax rhizosphaerae]|uniref:Uncharacterized protein n=1 Tax=Variovorax rhizosphaerae TaxID=1836200 RepID=A0ABU8WKI6_9BURK